MTYPNPHPSFMQLDLHSLNLTVDSATKTHIENCDRCIAYVIQQHEHQPIPQWVTQLTRTTKPPLRRTYVWWTAALASSATALSLTLILLTHDHRPHPSDDYTGIGVKGVPAVGLYVRHNNRVALWDGHRPIEPEDTLRLQVDPSGLTHVQVFVPSVANENNLALRQLYSADISPGKATLLPKAWQVDGVAGDEVLYVVIADRELSYDAVIALIRNRTELPNVWLRKLKLPKQFVQGH